jgi:hypothetical protein
MQQQPGPICLGSEIISAFLKNSEKPKRFTCTQVEESMDVFLLKQMKSDFLETYTLCRGNE